MKERGSCTECIYVFYVIKEMRGEFQENRSELDIVIDDNMEKIELCTGKIKRSLVQKKRIVKIITDVKKATGGTACAFFVE